MFSIAAINDTDSRGQWEPLAPTKEAQEFHLTQTYHEGLLKSQAKDYEKARELLETVLKDPLVSSAQVDSRASDGPLLQLRFLALKNLATVFLQQGSSHYKSALRCYLQAVEIDTKDSVVWNQLGTLSCSMGLLSISRWAFEQGLYCSPNNWNCMEKLLEVLIAIGDEVACLSVAELILRHWPSHSRALYVKNTIEESEPTPFTPRGIDKLEPKHVRLTFLDKRKATNDDLDVATVSKKLKPTMELHLPEAAWTALTGVLLEILLPLSGPASDFGFDRSGDIQLSILLPYSSENVTGSVVTPVGENMSCNNNNSEKGSVFGGKEAIISEEQHQERRSSRLERLRSRKPGKEELDFATSKDLAKVIMQILEPFIVDGAGSIHCTNNSSCSFRCAEVGNPLDTECGDVIRFVQETSKNYGAYHMGHLLLEEVASRGILYKDDSVKFLELEKLTRHWGQERTPECSLFLAELYYDFGSCSPDMSRMTDFTSEASYHLCKIIESVALDYPFHMSGAFGVQNGSSTDSSQLNCQMSIGADSLLSNKCSFWVRFFWLSGRLSILDGNKEKAREELCICLSLLTNKENTNMNNSIGSVCLPHCKFTKVLTIDRVSHEINLLEIDFLLKKSVGEMIEKKMYHACVSLLSPLLFSAKDVHPDLLYVSNKEGVGLTSDELLALDVLIKACEEAKPMDVEVYLNCRRRKLQILMVAAGMEDCHVYVKTSGSKVPSASETESTQSPNKYWNDLVAVEVKAISQCTSQMKNFINPCGNSNGFLVPSRTISDIQSLLLALMCNIASVYFSKKSWGLGISDQNEQRQKCCFIDAAIAFFKLQHLNLNVPVKAQLELVVAIHDMLADHGLCCAGGDGEEEEGTFLKLAIKHLVALDMKLKSNSHSLNKGPETTQSNKPPSHDAHFERSQNEAKMDTLNVKMGQVDEEESRTENRETGERISSQCISFHEDPEKEKTGVECDKCVSNGPHGMFHRREKGSDQAVECDNELTEDEREELELGIENALDQCLFCLYGLKFRSDSSYEDDLAMHKNTSRGDYQTREQCADVFQYILPYAKASSRTGLIKLRRVLRAIRKHFPQPPENMLAGNPIEKFLDDPDLCEDKLSEEAGSDGFLDSITKMLKQQKTSSVGSSEPYLEVYSNLYYLLAQSEEMSATDKWAGFVITKEGEEFVEQNANLFKYDLLYNPLRFESWQRLANIYDEEVDLLLNDGSKQINVSGWRKSASLSQRVETSRRRSRRCLLMTLALAKTALQQGEIHELLALVYYDGLQNVVPFYDQRSIMPIKDGTWMIFCQNAMRHFKKAFAHKEDWSYAFYLGKLCEKLGYSHDISFSYYDKAIALNPSAVDPFYRMHASRLKLLFTCRKQNEVSLKVVAAYSFTESTKETVMNIFGTTSLEVPKSSMGVEGKSTDSNSHDKMEVDSLKLEEVWHMLYSDCLSALGTCVEGDLKHFHKARYMLAQGMYRRGETRDLEKAKDELSFCFKSYRSSFTINMWEIDSMVKKGRRKTPAVSCNRKTLEVNLAESSRKFITCIRKYILLYWKLLEETGDISTLDRAYIFLRVDKRFSLCLEDLVPVVLGRYIKVLISSMRQIDTGSGAESSSLEHLLEKMFSLFLEQVNLWSDICNLPETRSLEFTESSLYGYLYHYIQSLEKNARLEILEGINEKIRKRLKNPKLSNSHCAKVHKYVSVAWCRSLVISMALITPLHTRLSSEIHVPNPSDSGSESNQLLCVDLQPDELWNSSVEDPDHLKSLETKWSPSLSKIKNVIIKRASDEDLETATALLRSAYNFYRDTSCAMLPSGVNLYMAPSQLATETFIQPGIDGVDILDMNTSRKLLLWAYTLLYGLYTNISVVVKYCEENAKLKMKKGTGSSPAPSCTSGSTAIASQTGGGKDGVGKCSEPVAAAPLITMGTALLETENARNVVSAPLPDTHSTLYVTSASLPETESARIVASASLPETVSACDLASVALHESESACNLSSASSLNSKSMQGQQNGQNTTSCDESLKISSATTYLLRCNNSIAETNNTDLQDG